MEEQQEPPIIKPDRKDYIEVTDLHKLWFKTYGEPLAYASEIELRVYNKVHGTVKILTLDQPNFYWGLWCYKIKELKG